MSRRQDQRGSSVIELALCFALLVPVFAGTYEFGYALFRYNQLIGAVRAGARYAALETYDSASTTPTDAFLARVRNMVVYGNPAGGTSVASPGLTVSNVALDAAFANSAPVSMTVRLVDYRLDAVFGMFRLNTPKVAFRYQGRFAPP